MGSLACPPPSSRARRAAPCRACRAQVARALVGLIVVAAFPVNHVPARSAALDLLFPPSAPQHPGSSGSGSGSIDGELEPPAAAYTAETLVFCGAATAIALCVSDLGEPCAGGGWVAAPAALSQPQSAPDPYLPSPLAPMHAGLMFQLVGGTAAAVLIFGIPGALLLRQAADTPEGGVGRAALWAGGGALELLTLASWGATLYNLSGRA